MALISYQLHIKVVEGGDVEMFWTETPVAGDARSCDEWEFLSGSPLTEGELAEYANAHWFLPEQDGVELCRNFDGIPLQQ
jgi:hypothetical protein